MRKSDLQRRLKPYGVEVISIKNTVDHNNQPWIRIKLKTKKRSPGIGICSSTGLNTVVSIIISIIKCDHGFSLKESMTHCVECMSE
jgi:hypothetical protein